MSRGPASMTSLLLRAGKRVRPLVRRAGYDVVRWPGARHGYLRSRILHRLAVDVVLDVGANVGQYGRDLRAFGYQGHIHSFEPMRGPFERLTVTAAADGSWTATRSAVGAESGELSINVAENSISSSLLPMLSRHLDAAPHSGYVSTESVAVERLDTLVAGDRLETRRGFLKIDTQGYEAAVLDGAPDTLRQVHGVELEMSLVPLYEGQLLMTETIDRLSSLGFRLTEVSPGFTDRDTGDTLQVDGIFVRA